MTTLLLVRHGETDWNRAERFQGHADPPLNALGIRQATELADRLAAGGATAALYTSDLKRSLGTAEIIGLRLGLAPVAHPGLREVDVGPWSGLTRQEVAARFPDAFRRWQEGESPPGWEPRADFVARVGSALLEIAHRHTGSRLVVVGHGGTIRAAEAHAGTRPSWPIANCAVVGFALENGALHRVG